ncbi:hypothetical protein CTI12_AA011700 [Artemisia annua]|uniref:Uncharacterized protein n=1 Tax=Artemisia annua TaxID=35608 RepID=A0A2U1QLF8_ARTAN|nr:hypothetical protein CTI12_AA011700 [Artemisia annua]
MEFLEDTRQRAPIILVLDKNIQMLPWERMEASKNQIYQMPSFVMGSQPRFGNKMRENYVSSSSTPILDD